MSQILTIQDLKDVLSLYLDRFPSESGELDKLQLQIANGDPAIFSRSNITGHVTASALVLDPAHEHILMIEHPTHKRRLQPGGHVELGCTSLWQAAMEEVEQETGLIGVGPFGAFGQDIPIDIDTHFIPANPKKVEGDHFHHDFVFVGEASHDFEPKPQEGDAIKVAQWVALDEFFAMPHARMQRMADKLRTCILDNPRAQRIEDRFARMIATKP
jgi:8-oxo-dGTP pyrophosphatase MutT (NUDIX family)